ncbi:MAG TPA: AAA family ATPase [bacterium]|nr:AAA family ATPase [bacterium]
MSRVVAVCGKGGVGKTTVSAILASELCRRGGRRVLLVDADHAGGLSMALGIAARRTMNQVRQEIIGEIKEGGSSRRDLALSLDYLMMEAVGERGPLAFLAIGRPEEAGCYCSVNTLLKNALELLAGGFDLTLIDAEAGVEQVSRQVMSKVDYLLLVSDTSAKGLKVAVEILDAATGLAAVNATGLLVNRLRSPRELESISLPPGIPLIGTAPEDDTIRRFDVEGLSFFDIPASPGVDAIIRSCVSAGII